MIWGIFAALACGVMLLLMLPLFRGRDLKEMAPTRGDYDVLVYKDQLHELERDVERGLLMPEQAQSARLEIQRRILTAAENRQKTGEQSFGAWIPALISLSVVLIIGGGGYALLGSPELPDFPHAEGVARQQRNLDMVEGLARRLEKNPENGEGWAMLARSAQVLQQPDRARKAYAQAIKLLPQHKQIRLEYARMLMDETPEDEAFPSTVRELLNEVIRLSPGEPEALYFLGIDAVRRGETQAAVGFWRQLQATFPVDSKQYRTIQVEIEKLH